MPDVIDRTTPEDLSEPFEWIISESSHESHVWPSVAYLWRRAGRAETREEGWRVYSTWPAILRYCFVDLPTVFAGESCVRARARIPDRGRNRRRRVRMTFSRGIR
jgi:hypothetical protein